MNMDEIKARVIVSVLGSAATVVTLASVVGAGKKWAQLRTQERGSRRATRRLPFRRRPDAGRFRLYIWWRHWSARVALTLAVSLVVLAPIQRGIGFGRLERCVSLHEDLVLTILVIAVIVGELRPVPIPRGGDIADMITISTTFTLALAIVGPVSLALIAQVRRGAHRRRHLAALAAEDCVQRGAVRR